MNRSRPQNPNYSSPSKRRIDKSPKLSPSPQKKKQSQTFSKYDDVSPSKLEETPQQRIDELEEEEEDFEEPEEMVEEDQNNEGEKLSRAQLEMKYKSVLNERDTLLNHLSNLIEMEMSENY